MPIRNETAQALRSGLGPGCGLEEDRFVHVEIMPM